MNSNNIRCIEVAVSISNIKAQIETFLRATKVIKDYEELVELSSKTKAFDINGKEVDVIPLILKIRREEVEVRNL